MVLFSQVRASNSLISSKFPTRLVALFVGGTSGIGETTLKKFAKYAHSPRAYLIGRSRNSAARIIAECEDINPHGEFIFVEADVSLIRTVDEVCNEIKEKETVLNIIFMSQGVMRMDRSKTSENIHLLAALNYYSRLRFITNLLPLLHNSATIRRIVNVGGGGKEGYLDATDLPALRVPVSQLRSHLSTLITLGLEAVAKTAPTVSFIHSYPGSVITGLYRDMNALPFDPSTAVPIDESGERHLYLATSAKFPPLRSDDAAVKLGEGMEVGIRTGGDMRTGIYSVGENGEGTSDEVVSLLAGLRDNGTAKQVWRHTEAEFQRVAAVDVNR